MKKDFRLNREVQRLITANDKKVTAVADRAGIRRDTFSRILNCKRPIYADEIIPICTALGVGIETLFSSVAE